MFKNSIYSSCCIIQVTTFIMISEKMFSQLAKSSATSLHFKNKLIFPQQHCVTQLNAYFDTYTKVGEDKYWKRKTSTPEKRQIIPKYVHNFYLPMGAKKASFTDRNMKTKENTDIKQKPLQLQTPDLPRSLTLEELFQAGKVTILVPPKHKAARRAVSKQSKRTEIALNKTETLLMSNTGGLKQASNKKDKDPKKPNLELVSHLLTDDLTNFFMKKQEWSMYHKDMVFQDNMRGKQYALTGSC